MTNEVFISYIRQGIKFSIKQIYKIIMTICHIILQCLLMSVSCLMLCNMFLSVPMHPIKTRIFKIKGTARHQTENLSTLEILYLSVLWIGLISLLLTSRQHTQHDSTAETYPPAGLPSFCSRRLPGYGGRGPVWPGCS